MIFEKNVVSVEVSIHYLEWKRGPPQQDILICDATMTNYVTSQFVFYNLYYIKKFINQLLSSLFRLIICNASIIYILSHIVLVNIPVSCGYIFNWSVFESCWQRATWNTLHWSTVLLSTKRRSHTIISPTGSCWQLATMGTSGSWAETNRTSRVR